MKPSFRGRLNGTQRRNLKRLLNMVYTPLEIATVVGFSRRQFYQVYIPMGCPHTRDEKGHIQVVGVEFRDWYHEMHPKVTMGKNETYCLTCRAAVPIINPKKRRKGILIYLISYCPYCDRKLTRMVSNRRDEHVCST